MPDVLKLAFLNLTRATGFGRGFAFKRLNACHLVSTHRMVAVCILVNGLRITPADCPGLLSKQHRVFFRRIQPVTRQMRFQISLVLKNARPVAQKCSPQPPRFLSLPVLFCGGPRACRGARSLRLPHGGLPLFGLFFRPSSSPAPPPFLPPLPPPFPLPVPFPPPPPRPFHPAPFPPAPAT